MPVPQSVRHGSFVSVLPGRVRKRHGIAETTRERCQPKVAKLFRTFCRKIPVGDAAPQSQCVRSST